MWLSNFQFIIRGPQTIQEWLYLGGLLHHGYTFKIKDLQQGENIWQNITAKLTYSDFRQWFDERIKLSELTDEASII